MDFSQRCSDADRDEAIKALSEHHAAGRIDLAEFDERSSAALSAKTYDDLHALFLDLPDPRPKWLDALVPAAARAPAPEVREGHQSLERKRKRKWVPVAQVVVWMGVLAMWLGVGIGGWWMVFVAIGLSAALGTIFEEDEKPEIESGQ